MPSDADPQDLVDADQSELRRLIDQLGAAVSAAESRAENHADAVRGAAVGRLQYDDARATDAERERVRSDPDVAAAVELHQAIRDAQRCIRQASERLDDLDGG